MGLEARDDRTDDFDSEYPEIHQVGRIAVLPNDANAKTQPDEDECCRKRNADGESVHGSVYTCSHERVSNIAFKAVYVSEARS
jgi:hypothetical protein